MNRNIPDLNFLVTVKCEKINLSKYDLRQWLLEQHELNIVDSGIIENEHNWIEIQEYTFSEYPLHIIFTSKYNEIPQEIHFEHQLDLARKILQRIKSLGCQAELNCHFEEYL